MTTLKDDLPAHAEMVSHALRAAGYHADYSLGSLWEIDRFFDENVVNGAAKAGGLLSSELGARLLGVGAYIGEVVRREKGGDWSCDDTDPQAEINAELQLSDGTTCWPVQRVMKRFKNGAEDGIAIWAIALGLEVGAPAPPASRKGFFARLFG